MLWIVAFSVVASVWRKVEVGLKKAVVVAEQRLLVSSGAVVCCGRVADNEAIQQTFRYHSSLNSTPL